MGPPSRAPLIDGAGVGPGSRLETVIPAGMWSTMPWFDTAARRWKIFYCNETDGTTRTAVASNEGYDSLSRPNRWSWSEEQPSQKTYSISNPFEVGGKSYVFLDHRLFAVSLAVSATGPAGPYTLLPDSNTPLINRSQPGNRSWIENPIVTPLPSKRFAAMFDWVQGGGQPAGSPLPYLGFAWSPCAPNPPVCVCSLPSCSWLALCPAQGWAELAGREWRTRLRGACRRRQDLERPRAHTDGADPGGRWQLHRLLRGEGHAQRQQPHG